MSPTATLPTATFPTTSTTDADDVLTWQLSDLHGDIAATLPATNTDVLHVSRPDEYGASTDDQPRHSWLGAQQRASDTPGGLTLMGVRLYNPATGRFLTPDPIYGGNPNTYTYPTDPINGYDLDGRRSFWKKRSFWKGVARWTSYAAVGACVVATAGVCGVAAGVAFGASAAMRTYSFTRDKGWRQRNGVRNYALSLGADFLSARAPGVRYVRGSYLPRHASRWRHYARPVYHTVRSSLRTSRGRRNLGYQAGAYSWARWG